MPFCSKCGYEVRDDEPFCEICGTRIRANTEGGHRRSGTKSSRTSGAEKKKEGVIHTCPSCGGEIGSFSAKCPHCGLELRDVRSSDSISELFAKLEDARSDNEKIHLIRTFPIPNSKEDIYEFMFMAVSNYNEHNYVSDENGIDAAWYAKIEQCYQKASVTFGGSGEFEKIEELYQSVKQKTSQATSVQALVTALPLLLIVVGTVIFMTKIKALQTVGSLILTAGIIIAYVRYSHNREQKFIEHPELRVQYEQKKAQGGFASWSAPAKVGWVVLNIYTLGIPALMHSGKKKDQR